MTRSFTFLLAGLLLGTAATAEAQTAPAPGTVVTPAPPPREGTVGPEQLRDFALPGTRQTAPAPAEPSRAAPATPPVQRTAPAPAATARPAPTPRADEPAPARSSEPREAPVAATTAEPAIAAPTVSTALPDLAPVTPGPLAQAPEALPLPPITVTQSGTQSAATPSLLPGWWPWLLVAALVGVGLALFVRQRRKPALAGHEQDRFERAVPEWTPPPAPLPRVPAPAAPAPRPQAAPAAPALPTGMVTTRLRSRSAPPPAPPVRQPAPPAPGGVVSVRLRAWVDLEVVVREILFDEHEALFRLDFVIANSGTGAARDIALEAVTTNAGDEQGRELAGFFARPAPAIAAVGELGPLNDIVVSHEMRMPRGAIRAYEAQGRALFVPIVALNAAYRTASGEGRTGAAFLVGREVPGSEKLGPLLLPEGAGRLLGLGVRRLEEAVRR